MTTPSKVKVLDTGYAQEHFADAIGTEVLVERFDPSLDAENVYVEINGETRWLINDEFDTEFALVS